LRACPFFIAALLCLATSVQARPRRLVVIKADGVPAGLVERWLKTPDTRTGRGTLPWIEHVFADRGARVRNFYVRGISLSTSSWTMLDSGYHSVIRGNAEFDRFTLRVYDYLNFFPFYLNYARSRRIDMPAVEVLDQAGIPLLIDRYPSKNRYQGLQLLQRGIWWKTLERGLRKRITTRSPKQLFDEWQTGFNMTELVSEQVERDLIQGLARDEVDYLDYFFIDYDHVAHLDNDEGSQFEVLKKLDALVGRIWTAIENSPRAADTILVLVSDHGMNSDSAVYSQGFNLIRLFNSAVGGGHHVITNRHPLTDYKLRGLDPFVSEVTSPSSESLYLAGEAGAFPTALLDLDGNERASIQFRNSDLNRLHMSLQRAQMGDATAAAQSVELLARVRPAWTATLKSLEAELAALRRAIERQQSRAGAPSRKFSREERAGKLDDALKRERAFLEMWQNDEATYRSYVDSMKRLLSLDAEALDRTRFRASELVPRRALGEPNTVHHLQNYAAGPGTVVDYFALLAAQRVRNNVQSGVSSAPVDFIAAKLRSPEHALAFLYADEEHQAILMTQSAGGGLRIRYLPVARLKQDAGGSVTFDARPWGPGFPLRIFEDPQLDIPGDRAAWLDQWHTPEEWLQVTHRTTYSNGVVGLAEHFAPIQLGRISPLWRDAGADEPLLRRFETRKREMVQADLLIVAANHWNFNVRGFNPGGNHGSFLRVSTHSVLMLSGAGVPRGVTIDRPYDSLSFVPTILRLSGTPGQTEDLPGRPILELLPESHSAAHSTNTVR
jgi:hypothetical protein